MHPPTPAAALPAADTVQADIHLHLNGQPLKLPHPGDATLLDLLQGPLALRGTRRGCDAGACGACTVLVNGQRVNACLSLALLLDGAQITTIEGLSTGDLHPMQQAFVACDALQCGYCTPGQILSAIGLQGEAGWDPSRSLDDAARAALREGMSGNLCRCGAYPMIEAAIVQVHQRAVDAACPPPLPVGQPGAQP